MSLEPTVASRLIFRGQVVALRVDDIRLPSGRIARREIVEHPGAAAVVPLTDEGTVILVRQYRKAVEETLLEIPAGTLEPGESPEQCAHRELVEEAGVRATSLAPLLVYVPSPGLLTERITIFLARGLRPATVAAPEEEEGLRVERVPLSALPAMIGAGGIRDGKTLVGLTLAMYALRGSFPPGASAGA